MAGRPSINWSKANIALLGTMSDAALAKKMGCSIRTIWLKRDQLNIAAHHNQDGIEWTLEKKALLGTDVDRAVAEKLGVAGVTVNKKRNELGIPAFVKSHKNKPKAVSNDEWSRIKQLPQGDLFAALKTLHDPSKPKPKPKPKPKLTHKHLAELTGYSLSRMQKWMTPGTAQEPMSLSTRHHLFLSVLHGHHI